MLRLALTSLVLFVLAGLPVQAQTLIQPESGDRVRISSDDVSGEYVVAQVRSESLVLRSDPASATFEVPTATLARLEVSRGGNSRLGAFVAGAFLGGVIGATAALPCASGGHFTCASVSGGHRIVVGAGLGALIGFVAWGGREVWEEVRIPGQLGPDWREAGRRSGSIQNHEGTDCLLTPAGCWRDHPAASAQLAAPSGPRHLRDCCRAGF